MNPDKSRCHISCSILGVGCRGWSEELARPQWLPVATDAAAERGNAKQTAWTSSCHFQSCSQPSHPIRPRTKSANLVVWPLAIFIFLQKRLLAFVKKGKKKIEEGRGPRDLRTCLNNGKAAAAGFVYVIKKGHSFEVTDEQPQRWPIKAAGL